MSPLGRALTQLRRDDFDVSPLGRALTLLWGDDFPAVVYLTNPVFTQLRSYFHVPKLNT